MDILIPTPDSNKGIETSDTVHGQEAFDGEPRARNQPAGMILISYL